MLIKMETSASGGDSVTPMFIDQSVGATISSAVASHTYTNDFTIDKSYDGSSSTAWMPGELGNNNPYNAIYDLGSAQSIFLIALQWACADSSAYVTKVTIYGSSDGTNYDLIVPETEITVSNSPWSEQRQKDIALIGKNYRYFKIAFSRVSGTANYCVGIGEIKFITD